jgi:hypothetical protein
MKNRFSIKELTLGAVVATGIALCSVPATAWAQTTVSEFCGSGSQVLGTLVSQTAASSGTTSCTESGLTFSHAVTAVSYSGWGRGTISANDGSAFSLLGFTASNVRPYRYVSEEENFRSPQPGRNAALPEIIAGTQIHVTATYADGATRRFVYNSTNGTFLEAGNHTTDGRTFSQSVANTYDFSFDNDLSNVVKLDFSINPVGVLLLNRWDASGAYLEPVLIDDFSGTGFSGRFIGIDNVRVSGVVAAVPEPSTYALMLTSLGVMGWSVRRHRRQQAAANA